MADYARLLCISNGHGEDAIATRILTSLQQQFADLETAALPLVGEGDAFRQQGIPLIGPARSLPSGGFVYMEGRQLLRDLGGGLLPLAWQQWRALRTWCQGGGAVLAVGDVIPTLFAWLSGLPYSFVGTAKSAYYWRNERGKLPGLPRYTGWSGSIYLPWERWLMGRDRCRAVIVRDSLTAQELRKKGLSAIHTANPMMDGLQPTDKRVRLAPDDETTLTVVLLPGSRAPEAYRNWQQLLTAVESVLTTWHPRPVHLLGAIAPALSAEPLITALSAAGWQPQAEAPYPSFRRQQGTLQIVQDAYADCLQLADCAIAMAGTATEQMVGLGKPTFTLPGTGPQFTPTFAKLQARLLGPSVILVAQPEQVGAATETVLKDPDRLQAIYENGRRRMGEPGGAAIVAEVLATQLLQ